LISQLWMPRVPSTTDDGYSSPKSEKESEEGEEDQDEEEDKKTCIGNDVKRPSMIKLFTVNAGH